MGSEIEPAAFSEKWDPCFFAGAAGFLIPDAGLYFPDVGAAKEQHTQPALSDASADGEGKLSGQQRLVEGKIATVLAACLRELAVQAFRTDADTHTAQFKTAL